MSRNLKMGDLRKFFQDNLPDDQKQHIEPFLQTIIDSDSVRSTQHHYAGAQEAFAKFVSELEDTTDDIVEVMKAEKFRNTMSGKPTRKKTK